MDNQSDSTPPPTINEAILNTSDPDEHEDGEDVSVGSHSPQPQFSEYSRKLASAKHMEYLAKLEAFIQKTNDSDFIKSQIANVLQDNLMDIYSKMAGNNGLRNLGNTCYMNSIIQCLRHAVPLNQYLFGDKIKGVLAKNQMNGTVPNQQIALLINYIKIVSTLWEHSDGVLSPVSFKALFSHIYSQFRGYEQHDSHEYLTVILNSLHETLARNVRYKITGTVQNDLDKHIQNAHEQWAHHYRNRHSAILDIFSGQLQTKTVCPHCEEVSYKYDPVMAMDIPLPPRATQMAPVSRTLYDCFNTFIEPRQLDEDNKYHCEKCGTKAQAYQVHSVWTLPNILIIKLNRFKYEVRGGYYMQTKLDDFIHYPMQDLNLDKYISSPLNDVTKYKLFAVSCHIGSAGGGHYYSYALNQVTDKWFLYDDDNVHEIEDPNDVITDNAYILFYQKQF